jgi:hypothetical protein
MRLPGHTARYSTVDGGHLRSRSLTRSGGRYRVDLGQQDSAPKKPAERGRRSVNLIEDGSADSTRSHLATYVTPVHPRLSPSRRKAGQAPIHRYP